MGDRMLVRRYDETWSPIPSLDVLAIVLVPLDPLFGAVIVAQPIVQSTDDELPAAPALSVRIPRAPPAA